MKKTLAVQPIRQLLIRNARTINAGLILLFVVLGSSWLFGAKPSNNVPAVATFSDRMVSGGGIIDNIFSDGAGPYYNATVDTNSYGHFVLRLVGSSRFLSFDYSDRLTGSGPNGDVDDYDVYFKIYGIANIPCGQSAVCLLGIDNTEGKVRFDGGNGFDGPITGVSQGVLVTRNNANTWSVTTDGTFETARLIRTIKGKFVTVGLYSMPFEMTITSTGFTCP